MARIKALVVALSVLTALSVVPISNSQAGSYGRILLLTKDKLVSNFASSTHADGIGAVNYVVGSPVITEPNVYVIWYGGWDRQSCNPVTGSNSAASIIGDLATNLGDSPWNNINASYYQIIKGERTYVSPSIDYLGCALDSGSLGLSLDYASGPQVGDVVKHALSSNLLPSDPNGVYMVLTNSNVEVNGFQTLFCGYHSVALNGSEKIPYGFVGDPSANMNICVSQPLRSPNENPSADAMANVFAHELIEPISDPYLNAWFDQSGLEGADKCAWKYGEVVKGANGAFSNMTLGRRNYLIQMNVPAHSNKCLNSIELTIR